MDQSAVMGQSWRLIWRRKSLLGLGCLTVLATVLGYVAIYAALIGFFLASPDLLTRLVSMPELDVFWPFSPWLYALTCGGVVLWLLIWLVGLAARGGLIAAVDELEDGGQPTFGGAFGRGWRRAPRLAVMAFVLFLPVIIFSLAVQAVSFAILPNMFMMTPEEMMGAIASFYAVLCGLSLVNYALTLFIQFIYPFAFRGVVLRELGARGAIRHGWRVLRGNFGEILPLALLYGVIMVVLIGLWYAAFLGIYFGLIFSLVSGGEPSPAFLGIIGIVLLGVSLASIVAGAILVAWRSAAFTIGYRRWTAPKAEVDVL